MAGVPLWREGPEVPGEEGTKGEEDQKANRAKDGVGDDKALVGLQWDVVRRVIRGGA